MKSQEKYGNLCNVFRKILNNDVLTIWKIKKIQNYLPNLVDGKQGLRALITYVLILSLIRKWPGAASRTNCNEWPVLSVHTYPPGRSRQTPRREGAPRISHTSTNISLLSFPNFGEHSDSSGILQCYFDTSLTNPCGNGRFSSQSWTYRFCSDLFAQKVPIRSDPKTV